MAGSTRRCYKRDIWRGLEQSRIISNLKSGIHPRTGPAGEAPALNMFPSFNVVDQGPGPISCPWGDPMNDFDGLDIGHGLKEKLRANGFVAMTDVQRACVPELLKGRNVIVQSPTGSGKTLAFLVPLLNHIHVRSAGHKSEICAVIIAPTRELSLQIKAVAELFGVACEAFIGGVPIEADYKRMETPFDIVVGTPGRLVELIKWDRQRFSKTSHVILDEADKLLSFGFEQKIAQAVEALPKERVTGLFSATINDSVDRLSRALVRNPLRLQIEERHTPVELSMEYMVLEPVSKLETLLSIAEGRRCIVFFATCDQVDFFHSLFAAVGFSEPHKIHGKMCQAERGKVYGRFMDSRGLLLCTDVAARGIDFRDIELVVHFDIPKDYSNIVHRSGRTARNGRQGKSIVFVMSNEKAYIEFLRLKNVHLTESRSSGQDETSRYDAVRSVVSGELLDLAVRAFVSYIRSYKEHIVSYILDYRGLNFDSLADLFFLEKIPNMTELRNVRFSRFTKPEKRNEKDARCKGKRRKSGRRKPGTW